MIKSHDKSILVPSCDKYADLWTPFFAFKNKFWKDCPYPVFLSSNTLNFTEPGVALVHTGKPQDWSTEIKNALLQIDSTYLLLILEDYFIYETVNQADISRLFEIAEKEKVDFLRIGCYPSRYNSYWPYEPLSEYDGIAEIKPGAKYRINLQTAIWNKQSLLELLLTNENPWEFEINGSKRANEKKFKSFCVIEDKNKDGIHGPIMYMGGAITKGKWMLEALRLSTKHHINLDTTKRPIETKKEELLRKIYVSTPLSIRPAYRYLTNKLGIKW